MFSRLFTLTVAGCFLLTLIHTASAQEVVSERADESTGFDFKKIPSVAINDTGSKVKWSVLQGKLDANSGELKVLNDGKLPRESDSPRENLFFAAGTQDGVLLGDLGEPIELKQIVTYSWHNGSRAPQVYRVYAATALDAGFEPGQLDPEKPTLGGWKLIADVDTRRAGTTGGQHAAAIAQDLSLGTYRYIRLHVQATDRQDRFSHTFFSEIDVVSAGDKDIERLPKVVRQLHNFASADGTFSFTIDSTNAPELTDWSKSHLVPVIEKWYPKIVAMLPSDSFEAPKSVTFRYMPNSQMRNIPAWAQGATISMNTEWFRAEQNREARGAVVHEMVHVVQQYQAQGGRRRGGNRPPGWLVEGIPDYIRWFLYEPESKGALYNRQQLATAKYDASYRVSGNFIDYVIRQHDTQGDLLEKLNTELREGRYTDNLWQQLTGKTVQELETLWKASAPESTKN